MSRTRLVNRDLNPLLTSLPSKFTDIYDYQIDAVTEIVEAFDEGYKVVVLEAPTGSGKTFIAEIVRRMLETRAAYVCHNKDLQQQFTRDFPYAKPIYGRANYQPERSQASSGAFNLTCEDCTWTKERPQCAVCRVREVCPYQRAKNDAIHSPVPVLNSAYWLNETQGKSRFANTGLVVFDEADTLEKVLMGQVEVYVSERTQERYNIDPPKRVTVQSAFEEWAEETLDRLNPHLERIADIDFASVQQVRELKRLANLHENVTSMLSDIIFGSPWVYTGGVGRRKQTNNAISFKPVKVDRFGKERIWDQDKRFLLMSATMISPSLRLASLGWTEPYRYVTMDSQFHAKNRQVVVQPTADMTRKGETDAGWDRMGSRVSDILRGHTGERVLIHSVSYKLTERLRSSLQASVRDRRLYSYSSGGSGRADSIAGFIRTPGSALIAPSADRGLDLPDDLCRAQIILKVPYLSLGDKQTQERLYKTPDGNVWYNVEVASTIMQMVGRGVRNDKDYCTCYILDSSFVKWYSAWGHLLPKWFRKGIRVE